MKKLRKAAQKFITFALAALLLTGCAEEPETWTEDTVYQQTSSAESIISDTGMESSAEEITHVDDQSEVPESTETEPQEESDSAETQDALQATEMSVHFIDVGQGDATLIINGEHAMLIDAGVDGSGTKLQSYLKKQGVERLDYLILTHTDADHIGAADVVITKMEIDTVFMGDFAKDTVTYRDTISALDAKSLSYSIPSAGSVYSLGDATFTIVAPNKAYDNANDFSIGLYLTKGNISFLFTGDAGENAEADMLAAGWNLDADVYHVGHHGSRYSSSQPFLDAVSPTYAVISCGEDNSYGHPHSQTLNALRSMGVKVFRTDEQGTIIATTYGDELKWNCQPSETWQAGESHQSSSSETAANTVEKENTEPPEADEGVRYICNTNTMKFHLPSCSSVDQMSEKNKLATNSSRDELISQGYSPCGRCKP